MATLTYWGYYQILNIGVSLFQPVVYQYAKHAII